MIPLNVPVAGGRLSPLPLVPVHGTHPAQQMGGIGGVVGPHGYRLDLHPHQAVFLHRRDKVHVHILRKDITARPVDIVGTQSQLVEDAQQGAGLLRGEVLVHREGLAHLPQQIRRRGGQGDLFVVPYHTVQVVPGVNPVQQKAAGGLLQSGGQGVLLLDGLDAGGGLLGLQAAQQHRHLSVLPSGLLHQSGQVVPGRLAGRVQGIHKGGLRGDGQAVVPGDPRRLGKTDQR